MFDTAAITTLESLVENGVFAPRVRFGGSDNATAYAKSVEATARGVLALAKARPDGLVDITNAGTRPSFLDREISTSSCPDAKHGPQHTFLSMNVTAPEGYGRKRPVGEVAWGPRGRFGLRAVILKVGREYGEPTASMTLVLPAWMRSAGPIYPGAIALAEVRTDGYDTGNFHAQCVLDEKGESVFTTEADFDSTLRYVLNLADLAEDLRMYNWGTSIGRAIGFPGAEERFSADLPALGAYFESLAAQLD